MYYFKHNFVALGKCYRKGHLYPLGGQDLREAMEAGVLRDDEAEALVAEKALEHQIAEHKAAKEARESCVLRAQEASHKFHADRIAAKQAKINGNKQDVVEEEQPVKKARQPKRKRSNG